MDDKHTKYRKAGLGRRIGFGERPAILIVDFNKGCLAKDSPLPPLMDLDEPGSAHAFPDRSGAANPAPS